MAEPRVLVVDDDDAVRGVVRAALERVGVRVRDAPDGMAGLRALAADAIDLVVLDWHLPGTPGLDVLRAIVREHPAVPVIVCTGAGDAERDIAMAAGAIDHITKARPLTELVRRVQAILAGDLEAALRDDVHRPPPAGLADAGSTLRAEVAAIAHELHNHLTVVLGHTDLVRTEVERSGGALARTDQVLQDLQAVASASERIAGLSRRLRELSGADAPADTATPVEAPSGGKTILLVEDDLDLRVTAERLLHGEGYDVLAAADAEAALELLREAGRVDLCVTDLLIPGGRPGEAAARIAEAVPGTALLVMSGHGADAVASSMAPPSAGFLAKPFTRDRLVDAIRAALGN